MSTTDARVGRMTARRRGQLPVPDDAVPPGPRWPALVQSVAMLRLRHSFTPWLRQHFGPIFTVRLVPERRPMVICDDPVYTRAIFAADPAVFHAGKANAVLGPVMGQHSLLLVDGQEHRRTRKLLMPAFGQSAMAGYEAVVTRIARAEIARWRHGVEFPSLSRMNALTLEVILQVVFGVADEERLARLRPLVSALVDVSPAVLIGGGYSFLRRIGPWKHVVDVQRELDALLYAEIAERRAAPDLHVRSDVLSRLLAVGDSEGEEPLSDAELRDQLVTLLLAGHETTASGLSWALHELGLDPALLARTQQAADAGDRDYLEAVMKEALRLHPVIPLVARFLVRPARVADLDLPAGVSVGPSILLSHRNPKNFPEPQAFRPERFLAGEVAPNTWIPFGGGVRRCIGAGFSLMEGVAVLREVVSALDLEVLPGHTDRPRVRNITSVPHRGARVVVRPRPTS